MSDDKGVGIVFLRRTAEDKGVLEELQRGLTKEEQHLLLTTMATTWVSMPFADRVWAAAARTCHPELPFPQALKALGVALAHNDLRGVYSIFAKVLSLRAVLKHSGRLWRTYHSRGRIVVERGEDGGREVLFSIHDYEELPECFRIAMGGWLDGVAQLCNEDISPFSHHLDDGVWKFAARWRG